MSDREAAIRARAHELWEQEGRPDGREHDHWLQAEAEINAQDESPPAAVEGISAIDVSGGDAPATAPKSATAGTAKMPAGPR
jgi:hypothetical protein